MKKTGFCPKCEKSNILRIKDILHANGAGNISRSKHIFTERKVAKITYFICKDCGFVESYLDQEELDKLD